MAVIDFSVEINPKSRYFYRTVKETLKGPLTGPKKGTSPTVVLTLSKRHKGPIKIVCQLVQAYKEHNGTRLVSANTLQSTSKKKITSSDLTFVPVEEKMVATDKSRKRFQFELTSFCIIKTNKNVVKEHFPRMKEKITPELVQLPEDSVITQDFGKDETMYLAFTVFIEKSNGESETRTIFSEGIRHASSKVHINRCCNSLIPFEGNVAIHLLLNDVISDYCISIRDKIGNWHSERIRPIAKDKSHKLLIYKAPKYGLSGATDPKECQLILYDEENNEADSVDIKYVGYQWDKPSGQVPILEERATTSGAKHSLETNRNDTTAVGEAPPKRPRLQQLQLQDETNIENPGTEDLSAKTPEEVVKFFEAIKENDTLSEKLDEFYRDQACDNEDKLEEILNHIYSLLEHGNVNVGAKFERLIALLIGGGYGRAGSTMMSKFMECVKKYLSLLLQVERKLLLNQVWSLCLSREPQPHPHAAAVLLQFCDDFVQELRMEWACSSQLDTVLQLLCMSNDPREHSSAVEVMKKLRVAVLQTNEESELVDNMRASWNWSPVLYNKDWLNFIEALEIFEQHDERLPIDSDALYYIISWNESDYRMGWLRVLYVNILRNKDKIWALYYTLSYIGSNLSIEKLCRIKILREVLEATNNIQLYNDEKCDELTFLNTFFKPYSSIEQFLEEFVKIQWNSVALLYWLQLLKQDELKKCLIIGSEDLLKLCACVRSVQNSRLRWRAIRLVGEIFLEDPISITQYLLCIETLLKPGDYFNGLGKLQSLIKWYIKYKRPIDNLSKRCYDIIEGNVNINHYSSILNKLRIQLKSQPKERHGLWRFLLVFKWIEMHGTEKEECLEFLRTEYDLNVALLHRCSDLQLLQAHLLDKLGCETDEERELVLESSVDLFVQQNAEEWSQVINPYDLLTTGKVETFKKLSELLAAHTGRLEDERILPLLVDLLKKFWAQEHFTLPVPPILEYANKYLSVEENHSLIWKIWATDFDNCWLVENILKYAKCIPNTFYIKGLLFGGAVEGEQSIEEAYEYDLILRAHDGHTLRINHYVQIRNAFCDNSPKVLNPLLDELLRINNDRALSDPSYGRHSQEHRIKMRAARALIKLTKNTGYLSEELWTALLASNEHLNITYMYELLVGRQLSNLKPLLERIRKLSTYQRHQQISLISVAHIHCMLNFMELDMGDLQELIALLLNTNYTHHKTYTFSKLIVHRLALKSTKFSIQLPNVASSIEEIENEDFKIYEPEARLLLPDISLTQGSADFILYMTHSPVNEYDRIEVDIHFYAELKEKLDDAKDMFEN
ncbi:uncharacterized protein LOC115623652 [Scaptodrosophila lebanonensis]|uniref:Uncharacterized protein LOC115623652 n=1 Tax=Drosophila lebanonensis TaxID=7225 RepID=A0A6J2TEW3_DROLE|nr:uncharacterized protein LOC115623652 [Scaptodrosophila lebanonensis]XP_030373966.1 uncharacterized protein LOC115623652 [Scaptodrosophila lebanonensis]